VSLAKSPRILLLGSGHCGDGEWAICRDSTENGCVVHSYGIGTNLTFEQDLVRCFGAQVRAFDPTPIALEWVSRQHLPESIRVFPWGISDNDGTVDLELPEQHTTSFVKRGAGPKSESTRLVVCPVKRFSTICSLLKETRIDFSS
jgi:hypothetical protein